MHRILATLAALLLSLSTAGSRAADDVRTERHAVRLMTVVDGLEHPWGMASLPDGRLLVTERPGRLRIVDANGRLGSPLTGVPEVVVRNQGGLLDVAVDPDFATNRRIYLSYAEAREGGNGTAVARARLGDEGLGDVQVIFRMQPAYDSGHHFGSRLVFARDKTLFVTLGDRNVGRLDVQSLDNHVGKVVRIDRDGRAPQDNPFVKQSGARPEIWSLGHRNIQGAALHPVTGELWTNEHGPKGGDELNRTLAGRNYGWPVISYGVNYDGTKVSDLTEKPGLEQPERYWVPSIAVSGMIFYTGDRFPQWKGNVFVGGLKSQQVVRLVLDGAKVVHEERLLRGAVQERVRDLEQGPDGLIYLLTDEENGRLLRMEPAD
jgi:glucose/arabinose dehydrogenase